jgi:hypothetical protein
MEIIPEFLNSLDKSNQKYQDLIKNYQYLFFTDKEQLNRYVNFKKNQESFYLKSEFMGIYLHQSKTWIWSWVTETEKSLIKLSNKLINYALSFEDDKLQREDFKLIRKLLINSRQKIESIENLDILLGAILYLTNGKFIIDDTHYFKNETATYYYVITDDNKIYLE